MNYYEALEEAGHVLRRKEDGEIDDWVLEYDIHNGPGCVNCDESWCEHCQDTFDFCPGREATDAKYKATRYEMYLELKEEFNPNG